MEYAKVLKACFEFSPSDIFRSSKDCLLAILNGESNFTRSKEIDIEKLDYYANTEEGRKLLETEFKCIEDGQRRPWTVAALPQNIKKNRYEDLLAYDETRVVLSKLPDDPYSDYINANFIDGYNSEKEYVATQGPLSTTINDFWRMIWQLNATKIVMLASLVEKGSVKVAKYWPESSATYGEITVDMISEHAIESVNHVIRTFSIKKDGIQAPRIIRHFHFTGWPDLGVPTSTCPVVSIMREARLYKPHVKSPILVHCSAGVGRTGTAILLDSMIQRALTERIVDFPKKLDHMRLQRGFVVEKEGQYIFAHKAVNDVLFSEEAKACLKEVEGEYRNMDELMSEEMHLSPKNLKAGLMRLKYHNKAMRLLLDAVQEFAVESSNDLPHLGTMENST